MARGYVPFRIGATLLLVLSVLFLACAVRTKRSVLSVFFDGVPTPEEQAAEAAARAASAAVVAAPSPEPELATALTRGEGGARTLATGPASFQSPIAALATWNEVLGVLPRDVVGGVDWVQAIKDEHIAPLASLPGAAVPGPPFALETLTAALLEMTGNPPLDLNVEIVPEQASFYKVVFPHSSHTLWLNCSSCHPGTIGKRPGMAAIFAGEYCGACHGKVAFAAETSCARCHANVVPADQATIEADLTRAREQPLPASPELAARGKELYGEACAVCHGENGDRNGTLAPALTVKPRDFTLGRFRLRSTSSGKLPTDYDLFRTITRGVVQSAMPSFSSLSFEDRFALVHYLKTFSSRFQEEPAGEASPVPEPPAFTEVSATKGKTLFFESGCHSCHGALGDGNGPSAPDLRDDWDDPIRPFDFTSGQPPKHGGTAEDYYRAIMTGLQGTPMPDYGEVFDREQAWAVVAYVMSLGEARRGLPTALKGDILFPRTTVGDDVPAATFPHWLHRIRFRCTVCHPDIFEMKKGANKITMDGMRQGTFCAKCHSGEVAWQIGSPTCVRCHVAN